MAQKFWEEEFGAGKLLTDLRNLCTYQKDREIGDGGYVIIL